MVRKAVKVLDALRDIYIRKKNAIEEERKAKEAELIRLGMIDAPMKKEDEAEYTDIGRAMELHDGQIVVPNAIIRKRVKVYAINNYGAYLHEAQQGEVSGALQLWYDLLELREGRYRLKPLRILRIATIQNNISMLLVEYYINYRKSEASQRRMTEANSIMSFMVDTVSAIIC